MYGKDEPFNDPVVRCDSCGALVNRNVLHQLGSCDKCGSRKVRNVRTFTSEELEQMKGWNVDPEFLKLFESVEVAP